MDDVCRVCGGRLGETCCGGTCCDGTTKCCDNGTCVPKCTNTGQCDYGELPDGPYVECIENPVTHQCGWLEGGLCNHLVTIATSDAQCADCKPNCDKERISACAEITPMNCTTHCYLLVCACLCDTQPSESYTVGDHYECAD